MPLASDLCWGQNSHLVSVHQSSCLQGCRLFAHSLWGPMVGGTLVEGILYQGREHGVLS